MCLSADSLNFSHMKYGMGKLTCSGPLVSPLVSELIVVLVLRGYEILSLTEA